MVSLPVFPVVFLVVSSVLAVFLTTFVFLLLLLDVIECCWVVLAGMAFGLVFPVLFELLSVFAVFVVCLRGGVGGRRLFGWNGEGSLLVFCDAGVSSPLAECEEWILVF